MKPDLHLRVSRWPIGRSLFWLLGALLLMMAVLGGFQAYPSALVATPKRLVLEALIQGRPQIAFDAAQRIIALQKDNILAPRILARYYREHGRAEEAAPLLENARKLAASDINLGTELGRTYQATGRAEEAETIQSWTVQRILATAGLNRETLVWNGEQFYRNADFEIALQIHDHLLLLADGDYQQTLFRRLVLSVLTERDHDGGTSVKHLAEYQAYDSSVEAHQITDTLQIPGAAFHRMLPTIVAGEPLLRTDLNGAGGFNMVPGEAVAIVSAQRTGLYELKAAIDGSPLPVQMAIGVNGERMAETTVMPDDGGWFTIEAEKPMLLHRGLNTVHVWFLPYESLTGQLRYSSVNWMELNAVD